MCLRDQTCSRGRVLECKYVTIDLIERRDTCGDKAIAPNRDNQSALQGVEVIPMQHSSYTGEMVTLFAEINSIEDNSDRTTKSDPVELIQAQQGLQ